MADPEPQRSSADSNITSSIQESDLNSAHKANGNPPESSAEEADGGNKNLVIDGISDDEDEDVVQKNQDGSAKPNGHSAVQPVGKTVATEEDLKSHIPGNGNGNHAGSKNGDNEAVVGVSSAPRKKKKKKPKSKRGLGVPTGFEEYYVDAPVTPAEFIEEKGLYDESRPFTERIEIAIQRYAAKRNLDSVRKDLFDKYLAYGGIEAGPKMFSGGLDAADMSNMNAAEIALAKAHHSVAADKNNDGDAHFVVDFEACAAAFLSSRLPVIYDLTTQLQIKSHTTIIFNFLNYLLHHDVCPEYRPQIYATRALCSLAEKELWQIVQAQALLPGDFNTACSEIFGGIFRGLYTSGEEEWAQGLEVKRGMSPEMARRAFKVGLAAQAGKEIFKKYKTQSEEKTISVTSITDMGLEVTEVVPATPQVLNIYSHDLAKGLKPLGLLKAKTWHKPGADDHEDLTEEEEAAAAATTTTIQQREVKEYEFWVEDHILEKCFVGMKFETTVTELSFGVSYFDALFGVYCSFYRVLPNEMMYGWKEPGPPLPMREKKKVNGDGNEGVGVGGEEEEGDGYGDEDGFSDGEDGVEDAGEGAEEVE